MQGMNSDLIHHPTATKTIKLFCACYFKKMSKVQFDSSNVMFTEIKKGNTNKAQTNIHFPCTQDVTLYAQFKFSWGPLAPTLTVVSPKVTPLQSVLT